MEEGMNRGKGDNLDGAIWLLAITLAEVADAPKHATRLRSQQMGVGRENAIKGFSDPLIHCFYVEAQARRNRPRSDKKWVQCLRALRPIYEIARIAIREFLRLVGFQGAPPC